MKNNNVTDQPREIDNKVMEKTIGLVISDLSASMGSVMMQIGQELGIYQAMRDCKYYDPESLAKKTGLHERYLKEWLNSQAAGGYISFDSETESYYLSEESALVLADEESPAFLGAGFSVAEAMWTDKEKLKNAFKSGEGIGWHEHHHSLFFGTEAFYRSGYRANLVNGWIPKLTNIQEQLETGGKVADIGCGHGASTILMAREFPNSIFHGFDYHYESILVARSRAEKAGLENTQFSHSDALGISETYDLICFMDAFHDFGDPLKIAEHAYNHLGNKGSLLLVEPFSSDNLQENFNPIGRMFYSASTALCVPHANSQEGKCCLGAQAGPSKIIEILNKAGFQRVSVVERTPVNLIIEAKK